MHYPIQISVSFVYEELEMYCSGHCCVQEFDVLHYVEVESSELGGSGYEVVS